MNWLKETKWKKSGCVIPYKPQNTHPDLSGIQYMTVFPKYNICKMESVAHFITNFSPKKYVW